MPGKILLSASGVLTVVDVANSDEGEYMCKASNIGGSATMHTRLEVRGEQSKLRKARMGYCEQVIAKYCWLTGF